MRSLDAILLVDLQSGKILEANDASIKVFRVSIEQLHERTLESFCPAAFLPEFRKMLRIASRRYHPKAFEIPMSVGAAQETQITAEMAASPLKLTDQSEVLQLIFRDITEKKENEKKIAQYIAQVEDANRKLEELATTDGMTGLFNFRQFSKLLEMEHTRSARYGKKYALIFCDLDHFKKYNDQNGHPAGDALLKEFAKILKGSVRNTDIAARYGGEEFIALCPETDAEQALVVAERIRSSIASAKLPHSEKQPLGFVSVSIGVAGFPADGKEAKDVLNAADAYLYKSKEGGRNRVTWAKGTPG